MLTNANAVPNLWEALEVIGRGIFVCHGTLSTCCILPKSLSLRTVNPGVTNFVYIASGKEHGEGKCFFITVRLSPGSASWETEANPRVKKPSGEQGVDHEWVWEPGLSLNAHSGRR